jgi:hypothetical protein
LLERLSPDPSEDLPAQLTVGDPIVEDQRAGVGEPQPGSIKQRRDLKALTIVLALKPLLNSSSRVDVVEHLVLGRLLAEGRERGQRREPPQLAHVLDVARASGPSVHHQRPHPCERDPLDAGRPGRERAQLTQPTERLDHPVGVRLHRPVAQSLEHRLARAVRHAQQPR